MHTLAWQSQGTSSDTIGNTLRFTYDASGSPMLVTYNGTAYYYETNLQGDIIAIVNAGGQPVVQYEYDPWGKVIGSTQGDDGFIYAINPLLYRGYVYDHETQLYYLQSRYYDPSLRRFINADGLTTTGQGILGNNMFAYCGNNPVNRADCTGQFWDELFEFGKTVVEEIGKAMGAMAPAYNGCGGIATADGPLPIGDAVGLVGAACLTFVAVIYGTYQATKAPAISIPKVEAQEKVVAKTLPPNTPIYRYGGADITNLVPTDIDVIKFPTTGMGLSFSTRYKPGAAVTTIEALNATGLVYAVYDGGAHVSVHPVGGTLKEWHDTGTMSIWTMAVRAVVVEWDG